jgi:plasmid stabilization system protein ParE
MHIRILESAIQDLIHGFKFYEQQGVDLGSYFLDSLFSDIDSLLISAGIHSVHFKKYRLLSKRFPFAIYYTIQDEIILIHAVLDCRQNPRKTSQKLK